MTTRLPLPVLKRLPPVPPHTAVNDSIYLFFRLGAPPRVRTAPASAIFLFANRRIGDTSALLILPHSGRLYRCQSRYGPTRIRCSLPVWAGVHERVQSQI